MKKKISLATGFVRHMSKSNVSAHASSAAYFIFLSLIPIIILLCSLLPLTSLQKSDLLRGVAQVMPSPLVPMMSSLIESLYNSTVGVVSVAAIVTIWSAGKGMLALIRGLNAMNGVVEDRNYFVQRLLASFYTVVLLAILLISLVFMVFGDTLVRVLNRHIPVLDEIVSLLMHLKPLFSWGILTLVFMTIFAFVPNIKLKWKNQFPGALFTAVSWNLFSWGFSIYIEQFNDFGLYGSLSAIVVVMMWLYFCMYLLLVGAHINRFMSFFSSASRE
ncbi:MAG: YihY/virulence factor BrkB family protein [Eubacteriales bacterium]|nr:YihY/virulence factor BrkB family protein [Eubacteriales bacterium]